MLVYAYDYETGAFTGTKRLGIADIDPRSHDTLLLPGNTTLQPPPRCGTGLWPFWRNGRWEVFQEVETPGELFFSEFDN